MTSSQLGVSVLIVSLLASSTARADGATTQAASPTSPSSSAGAVPVVTTRPPAHRRSDVMFGSGIAAVVVGGLGLTTGFVLLLAGSDSFSIYNKGSALYAPPRENPPLETAGTITLFTGLGLATAGIPLISVGGHREPDVRLTMRPLLFKGGGGAGIGLRY